MKPQSSRAIATQTLGIYISASTTVACATRRTARAGPELSAPSVHALRLPSGDTHRRRSAGRDDQSEEVGDVGDVRQRHIRQRPSLADNFKVIAYPWTSTDVPLVMTSWGFMLRFPTFDSNLAATFIQQHRNRSPEPNAP